MTTDYDCNSHIELGNGLSKYLERKIVYIRLSAKYNWVNTHKRNFDGKTRGENSLYGCISFL